MAEIQGGRWDNFLRRLFDLKEGTIAPGVMPEVAPHVDVDPNKPEYEYLRGIGLRGAEISAGAVAGEYSYVQLVNPAGNTQLMCIDHIWIAGQSGATDRFSIRYSGSTLGNLNASIYSRDPRHYPGSGGMANNVDGIECRIGSAVALQGAGLLTFSLLADTAVDFPFHHVLWPDDLSRFTIWCETVNRAVYATLHYHTRPITQSEQDVVRY